MFYWFLKCLLRVSLQSPGIPFFQCIKLYQVTCYSLSQIQLAIKFEYIFFLPTQKDISAFNIRYQNAQNNNNTPTEQTNDFKFHDLSTCAGLGPTFYWYHVLTQIWRKNSQGRPNTDRQISKFMCFLCFFAGRMEEHVHVFYFCNGFSMCSIFFLKFW